MITYKYVLTYETEVCGETEQEIEERFMEKFNEAINGEDSLYDIFYIEKIKQED